MDKQKISPFSRTLSPIRNAAQKPMGVDFKLILLLFGERGGPSVISMYAPISVCLPDYPSVCTSVFLSLCLSNHLCKKLMGIYFKLFLPLFGKRGVPQPVPPCVSPFIHPSVQLHIFFYKHILFWG